MQMLCGICLCTIQRGKAVVIGGGFVGIEVAEKVAQGSVVIDIRSKALHDGKALGLGTLFPCTIDTDNI